MAVLDSFINTYEASVAVLHWTTDIVETKSWIHPPDVFNESEGKIDQSVTLTRNFPVLAHGRVVNGFRSADFFHDFYFRVRLDPYPLALGNLLSSQDREIHLWNAFPDRHIELTDLTISNIDGATLSAPAGAETLPVDMTPNQVLTYTLHLDVSGSPDIDGTITWVTDEGSITLPVTGSRVVMFPFLPNWGNGVKETLTGRSTVFRSRLGYEQTVTQRVKFRRSYALTYTFLRGLQSQKAENLFFGWQSRLYGLPAWPEQGRTTVAIPSGGVDVTMATTGRTIVPGGLVMVFQNNNTDDIETREVDTVTSGGFTVKTPFSNTWPAHTRVVPVFLSAVNPELSGTRQTDTVMAMDLSFDCEPSSTDALMPLVAPDATYHGYEIYFGRTNWRDGVSINFNSDVQRLDQQTGKFLMQPQSDFSPQGRAHDWQFKNLLAVFDFRKWLRRRQGKAVGVWMPSAFTDFILAADISAADNTIRVQSNGYSLLAKAHPARRDIYLRLYDGTYFVGRIIDAVESDNKTELLTMSGVIGRNIPMTLVRQFSFLNFYRMSDDATDIVWYAAGIAESTTGMLPTRANA